MIVTGVGGEPLSNVDSAWLRMEDRTNLMIITGLMCFDEKLDFQRFKAILEERFLDHDRFRQRVVESRNPLGKPRWVDDEHFNLRSHLFRMALPEPGGKAELQEVVSSLMSTPLDFTKPLWQFHFIENYKGGSAVVARLHHCIADGIALVRVLLEMTDDSPETRTERRTGRPGRHGRRRSFGLQTMLNTAVSSAVRFSETVTQEVADALREPERAMTMARDGAVSTAAVLGKLLTMPPDPPTVFRGPLCTAKRCAWSDVLPLADVKAFSKRAGATINDVLLTGVAGALRRYIQRRGGHPEPGLDLRAVIPVNLRPPTEEGQLGNRFGLVFLALPVGISDWRERLVELKRRMDEIKGSPEAVVAFAILNALGMASPEIEGLAVRILGSKATAVMTNVPGPREKLYLAGHPIRTIMFWVPQSARLGLGVSILSYAGQVRLGIATDTGLVRDPEGVIAAFHTEMEDMMES